MRGQLPENRRKPLQQPDLSSWQRQLLDLVGYGASDLRVVHGRPVRVERMLVSSRPVLLKRWALPPALDVWRRVADAVGSRGSHPRIYLSRTRFHADRLGTSRVRTESSWDALLDATFADSGFLVVHPETLSIVEQITLVRGAGVLAGLSGSALHLSVFADPGTRVLTIGDQKSPLKPTSAQVMIDAACTHRTAFVANNDRAGLSAILTHLG